MLFEGQAGDPEDGTVVVVGDIGEAFGADCVLFRTARGLAETKRKRELKKKLAAWPSDAPGEEREALERALRTPESLRDAAMTLRDPQGRFSLYDFYGNPVAAQGGKIIVPLDHRGFFLGGRGQRTTSISRPRSPTVPPRAG